MSSRPLRNRPYLGNRLLVVSVLAFAAAVAIAVAAARGQSTVTLVPLPPGATTDCNPRVPAGCDPTTQPCPGGAYAVRAEVHGYDLASKRLRYGPRIGSGDDLGGSCLTTEAERAQTQEAMVYRMVGCTLDPGEGVTYTADGARWVNAETGPGQTERWEEQVEDAGLVRGLAQALRQEYALACNAPSPTATPPVSVPTPRPAASPGPTAAPVATPAPVCPPERQCPVAPVYVPRAVSPRVHEAAVLARSLKDGQWIGRARQALLKGLAAAAEEAGLYRQEPSTSGTLTTTDPAEVP